MDSTAATHSKFLDRGLHKKQRRAAGAKSSRQYYVKETDWLAGTSAVAQAVPAFFEDDAQVGSNALSTPGGRGSSSPHRFDVLVMNLPSAEFTSRKQFLLLSVRE